MRPAELRRMLRGTAGDAVRAALASHPDAVCLLAGDGSVLLGDAEAPGGDAPLVIDGEPMGSVRGPRAGDLAPLLSSILAIEVEKRALAEETLGRYKELTLLYDLSEQLARLLDLDAVARHAVEQCRRHLRAEAAVLFVVDPTRDALEALAAVGPFAEGGLDLDATNEVCARVYHTGHAEIVADAASPVLCAPLRHADAVLGVLRLTHRRGSTWSPGDLKLVTALAANVASALHKARLHTERVQAMALRHQVQRHTSPDLLDAVFDGAPVPPNAEIAVLFGDLRAACAAAATESPDALLARVDAAVARALDVLLANDAVVDLPLGEMLVAVFWDPDGLAPSARRAAGAASALAAALPGVRLALGIAAGALGADPTAHLHDAINAAARLHEQAEAEILVDARVREATGSGWPYRPHPAGEGCAVLTGFPG